MRDLLKKLSDADGVSSKEREVTSIIENELEKSGIKSVRTQFGNLHASIGKKGGKKIMFAAHTDEIGFLVANILPAGFLTLFPIGSTWSGVWPGQMMTVTTVDGEKYRGCIGCQPPDGHDSSKVIPMAKLTLDVGCQSKEEVLSLGIAVGDMISPYSKGEWIGAGGVFMGKAMDDRAQCAVLTTLMTKLKKTESELNSEIVSVFTAQEEVGTRGARIAAEYEKPDIAVVLDVASAKDIPGSSSGSDRKFGEGPCIVVADKTAISDPVLYQRAIKIANENGIPFHADYLAGGGTDAGAIQLNGTGIPTVTFILPTRYCHSGASLVHYVDMEHLITWLTKFIESLGEGIWMEPFNFDEVIDRKGTFCTQWDYIADRFGADDILPFSISDMDFKAPQVALNAIEKSISHGIYGYSRWNHSEFKSTVVSWFQRRFDANVDEDWVVYSPSIIFTLAKIIGLRTKPEEEILVLSPAYDAFPKTIVGNGRKMITSSLIQNEEGAFEIDFADFAEKAARKSCTMFLLCNPQNPTGRVFTREELAKMVAICRENNLYLVSDEVHMDVLRKGQKHVPISEFLGIYDKIALLSSTTKTFNIPALIFSYALFPDEALRDEFLFTLKEKNGLSSVSILGMTASMACYEDGEPWLLALCDYMDRQFDYLKSELAKIQGVTFHIPEGSYLAWIDLSGLNRPMPEIQKALIEVGKVGIMPGGTYGAEGEHFLRMNLGAPRSKIEEGIKRLKKGLDSL